MKLLLSNKFDVDVLNASLKFINDKKEINKLISWQYEITPERQYYTNFCDDCYDIKRDNEEYNYCPYCGEDISNILINPIIMLTKDNPSINTSEKFFKYCLRNFSQNKFYEDDVKESIWMDNNLYDTIIKYLKE